MVSLQHSHQIANVEEPIPLMGKDRHLPASSGSELGVQNPHILSLPMGLPTAIADKY